MTSRTRFHYESLGYEWKGKNHVFTVPLEHLSLGSNIKVKIKCDNHDCDRYFEIKYVAYNSRNDKIKDLCDYCKFRPFKDKSEYIPVIHKLFSEKGYVLEPFDEYTDGKQKFKYTCIKHDDIGIQEIRLRDLKRNRGCRFCAKENTAKKRTLCVSEKDLHSSFEMLNWMLMPDQTYQKVKSPLYFICNIHKNFDVQTTTWERVNKGQGCKGCRYDKAANTLRKNISDYELYNAFESLNYELLPKQSYTHAHGILRYICNKHRENGVQTTTWNRLITLQRRCPNCAIENMTGENAPNWKGGVSTVQNYLRSKLDEWKQNSLEHGDYRCSLTGLKKEIEIHHLYNFNKIVKEIFKITSLPIYQDISKYTPEELRILEDSCVMLHSQYGLGVLLKKDIHELFHKTYGFHDNTEAQFNEFKNDFILGKYN